MSYIKDFISKLEDFELASFKKYRYHTLMENSRNLIDEEFKSRQLDPNNYEAYLPNEEDIEQQKLESEEICPQCYSNEFYMSSEVDQISFKGHSLDLKEDFKTCLVCLYSQDKKDTLKRRNRIGWNIFGFFKLMTERRR